MAANSEKTAKKPRGKPFEPGKSGNPNGRPKLTERQQDALEAIRALAPSAPGVLSQILNDASASPAVRLKAVEMILDRTYGKPDMAVKVEDNREETLADIRAEFERIKGGGGCD